MPSWIAALFLPTLASAFVVRPHQTANFHGSALNMATWSDSKAVEEYKNFLDTGRSEPDLKPDIPSVIIMEPDTPCELAEALYTMGFGDDLVIAPYDVLPDQMDDVLKEYGFCRDSMTQVLATGLTFTPAKQVRDLSVNLGMAANEEQKIAGQCTACGKWNGAISARMFRNDVMCKTAFYRDWRRAMWEQSMSDAVLHLLGAVRNDPTSVANVATYYSEEAADIVWEVSAQLRGWKALTLPFGFEERIYGVAEANGAEQQCVVFNEMWQYIWGIPVFLESNMYLQYLHYAQSEMGLLQGIQLPPITEKKSIMRQGNMRADGVV